MGCFHLFYNVFSIVLDAVWSLWVLCRGCPGYGFMLFLAGVGCVFGGDVYIYIYGFSGCLSCLGWLLRFWAGFWCVWAGFWLVLGCLLAGSELSGLASGVSGLSSGWFPTKNI